MKFIAAAPGPGSLQRFAIIESPTAFDARRFAEREFGAEGLSIIEAPADAVATIQLDWTGSDAGAHPNRHLRVRRRRVGSWGGWRRA